MTRASRATRVSIRASSSTSCSTPSVFSSVSRNSLSLSPVANARTWSRYASAYVRIIRSIASSDSALANPSSASDAAIRRRSQVKCPRNASSKSLTSNTRMPAESMYVPKFSACRSPWIHTRLVRSSAHGSSSCATSA